MSPLILHPLNSSRDKRPVYKRVSIRILAFFPHVLTSNYYIEPKSRVSHINFTIYYIKNKNNNWIRSNILYIIKLDISLEAFAQ